MTDFTIIHLALKHRNIRSARFLDSCVPQFLLGVSSECHVGRWAKSSLLSRHQCAPTRFLHWGQSHWTASAGFGIELTTAASALRHGRTKLPPRPFILMKLYEQSDSDEFDDVELERREAVTYQCIDYASTIYIVFVVVAYLCIVVLYGLVGFMAPSKLSKVEKVVRVPSDGPVSLDVRLMDLQESDFEFELNCRAMRSDREGGASFPVKMSESHRFIRDYVDVSVSDPASRDFELVFQGRKGESAPIRVLPVLVNGFDSVAVNMKFDLQGAPVDAFKFSYYHLNPACVRFRQTTRSFMSAAIFYCLVVFLMSGSLMSRTSMMSIVLGVLGVLASNPVGRRLADDGTTKVWLGIIFMAVFVNYYRFFVLCQLNIMKNQSENVSNWFLIIVGAFFVVYTAVDALADWERNQTILKYASSSNDWSLSDYEVLRYGCLAAYIVLSAWITSRIKCTEIPDRDGVKVFCFILVTLVPIVCIIVGQIVLDALKVGYFMSLPDLLIDVSYMLGAAACILWMKRLTPDDLGNHDGGGFILESESLGY